MEIYNFSPAKTLAVTAVSAGFLAADLKPTTGPSEGVEAETVMIVAVGAIYIEFGGGAATANSMPIAAGSIMSLNIGYDNIKNLRFLKQVGDTSVVATFGYR